MLRMPPGGGEGFAEKVNFINCFTSYSRSKVAQWNEQRLESDKSGFDYWPCHLVSI